MLIEWIKLIPGLGDLLLRAIEAHHKRIREKRIRKFEEHISSSDQNFFRDIKNIINKSYEETNCDYVLYLEYHNGTKNAIGVPYEKFDMYHFNKKTAPVADFISGMITGVVQEYDVLDLISEDLVHNYSLRGLKSIDPKFTHFIEKAINDIKYVVTVNIRPNVKDLGCIMYISTNKKPIIEECVNNSKDIVNVYLNKY